MGARSRKPPPLDFRYVGLHPGPSTTAAAAVSGVASLAALGVGALHFGQHPALLVLALAGAGVSALSLFRGPRFPPVGGARPVSMAIVPWGVLVAPETEGRVLHWPAVQRVTVDVTHTLRGGTPSAVSSVVTVFTEREVLAGRAPGAVSLEVLLANLEAYSAEAARPVALDLDGREPVPEGPSEPAVGQLLRAARAALSGAEGAERLRLPPGTYRSVAIGAATPETAGALGEILGGGVDAPADPRPLAALCAGLLDARPLVPSLVALVSSPHPLVAACAKAAALRLGAPQARAGALEEIESFLFAEDLELLAAFARAEDARLST
jgi:hypothetical protein